MAEFGRLQLTDKGLALQTNAQIGAELQFTRVGIGDGELNGLPIAGLVELIDEKMSLPIDNLKTDKRHKATVTAAFSNKDLVDGFYFRELGLYATDPDEGEILYCYANAGDTVEYIPPGEGDQIVEKQLNLITIVGNAENVSAIIDDSLVFAKQADLDELESYVDQQVSDALNAADNANTAAQNAQDSANNAQITANTAKTRAESHASRHATGGEDPLSPDDIGAALASHVGDITTLSTVDKTNLVNAVNELFQNVSDGKLTLATAIADMHQAASGSDTFAQLAAKIRAISNDANATSGQVLAGRTFYQGGEKKTGTMPNNGSLGTITPGTTNKNIPSGYTTGGTVAGDSDLVTGNIRAGVNIFGVSGDSDVVNTGDANAAASQILSGRTAYVNGSKVTGTMPNRSGEYAADQLAHSGNELKLGVPDAGYYADSVYIVQTDNDWIPQNIREGINIFGKTGTLKEGAPFAEGSTASTINGGLSISGLGFQPQWFVVHVRSMDPESSVQLTDGAAVIYIYSSRDDIHYKGETVGARVVRASLTDGWADVQSSTTISSSGFSVTNLPSLTPCKWFAGRWS